MGDKDSKCDLCQLYSATFLQRSSVNEFCISDCNMDCFPMRKQYAKEGEVREEHIQENFETPIDDKIECVSIQVH